MGKQRKFCIADYCFISTHLKGKCFGLSGSHTRTKLVKETDFMVGGLIRIKMSMIVELGSCGLICLAIGKIGLCYGISARIRKAISWFNFIQIYCVGFSVARDDYGVVVLEF